MEVLIQNNGDAPFTVPIKGQNGLVERTLFLGEHQVTKVSQEVYEKFIVTSGFFKSRMEDGTIRVLNADMIGESAVEQSRQFGELAYQKYVDMMKKIRSVGGLANKQFQPYLNADGTPKLELLHANFGRNIDPQVAEQFRQRYLAEANEGMHEDTLKLPGGVRAETGVREVEVLQEGEDAFIAASDEEEAAKEDQEQDKPVKKAKKQTKPEPEEDDDEEEEGPSKELLDQIARIKKMNLGELKDMADAMEIQYNPTATERQLRTMITKKIKEKE